MKMVYTNESLFLVNNTKNIIEAAGIVTFLKNEFSQGAAGEISAFDCWPEIWVQQDSDYEKAIAVVASTQKSISMDDWICNKCCEKNDASFEICWQCQHEQA
ncbi:DUF2007 domain-containing protein [Cognaticolwellia aestuarii]|jgi:hypothetical protein|uniref:putative signal transducing protein n=1 Tax=Cognaticolwellia aestuarii TaxID=329993 RepID=UPI0009849332|nr:DUF2007 domain-containing protein [Cognaticolwellia aestuarii]